MNDDGGAGCGAGAESVQEFAVMVTDARPQRMTVLGSNSNAVYVLEDYVVVVEAERDRFATALRYIAECLNDGMPPVAVVALRDVAVRTLGGAR